MRPCISGVCLICFLSGLGFAWEAPTRNMGGDSLKFLEANCLDCHAGADAEAGLDLSVLANDLEKPATFDSWVKVVDRVSAGEMPPPEDSAPIQHAVLEQFISDTSGWLSDYQGKQQSKLGRVRGRRLTNRQLERSLQDLLGIDIPLEREMPATPKTGSFSTLAAQQSMSHFQLEQHLKIVDLALDEAFHRGLTPSDHQLLEMSAKDISRTRTRTREPEFIDGAAVIWSSNLTFYGRLPATTAREDGWYRFRFQVSSLKQPKDKGVWCTVRSGKCVSSAPLMAWVDAFETFEEPKEIVLDAWLPAGHMLEIRPGDGTLKMAKFQGGQSANGEGGRQDVPGIKIDWLSMERIHLGPTDDGIRELLFGHHEVVTHPARRKASVRTQDASRDGRQLLASFASRAFRRPATTEQLEPYVEIFDQALDSEHDFVAALRAGYRAILCSARFLYFQESPGQLDDYAIATRLSYLLWNSTPDAVLMAAAAEGELSRPAGIRQQVARMLDTERGKKFIEDFAYEWLELSEIDFTDPDRKLHPDFDIIVQQAMLDETHSFLGHMLENNLSVELFADCDYTFANSRLARFYDLEPIADDEIRRVALRPSDHRGGLLAQGAILKVTANGTNTSPVLRGVWISRRVLGQPIPPPPENVPAIEPDIRGAKTIREQLEKHRSLSECASCHAKIDPPGYALESFDAAGNWRDFYPKLQGKRVTQGARIDSSFVTADGHDFANFDEFRKLIAASPEPLARNFAEQLLTYGTGASITFADREEVNRLVDQARDREYGLRSILDAVVTSPIFTTK